MSTTLREVKNDITSFMDMLNNYGRVGLRYNEILARTLSKAMEGAYDKVQYRLETITKEVEETINLPKTPPQSWLDLYKDDVTY